MKRTDNSLNISDIFIIHKRLMDSKKSLSLDNGFSSSTFLKELRERATISPGILNFEQIVLRLEDMEKIRQFKIEVKSCLKSGEKFPLLILNGPKGYGKRSLASSIAFSMGLNVSKLKGEGDLQIIDRLEHEDDTQIQVLITNGIFKSNIKRPFYEIHFSKKYYREHLRELLNKFSQEFDLLGYSEELENMRMKDFLNKHLEICPSTIEALFHRGKKRASLRGEEFSIFHLKEALNSYRDLMEEDITPYKDLPSLDEVVLSKNQKRVIEDIIEGVKLDSNFEFLNKHLKSTVVLFSGPSGTGKSMSAKAIARELKTPLYKISASDILGKYVGESEVALKNVFDRARQENLTLLFDEVDSLLRNRDEGDRSWERSLTNTFLNLLESHQGLVFFTTNFSQDLDPALNRRINFKVKFPKPTMKMQETILEELLSPDAPLVKDFNFKKVLQGLDITGGLLVLAVKRLAPHLKGGITEALMREKIEEVIGESRQVGGEKKIGF